MKYGKMVGHAERITERLNCYSIIDTKLTGDLNFRDLFVGERAGLKLV